MATATTDKRSELAPALARPLEKLRRRIRQYVWAEGIASTLAWLGVAFWISLGADWFFEPSAALRIFALAAVGGVSAAIVVRRIGRRAFVPLKENSLATLLERRFPHLDDSLLTAVDSPECNPEMLAETRSEAIRRMESVSLGAVFNLRPLRQSVLAAALLAACAILFAAIFPDSFRFWALRTFALSDELWPRRVELKMPDGFINGVRKVGRGSDVEITVRAEAQRHTVPSAVQIRYREEGGASGRAAMERVGEVDPRRETHQPFTYTRRNVHKSLRFDVVGGDAALRDLSLIVVDNPTISGWSLECAYPDYLGRPPRTLPIAGVTALPQGSRAVIRATSNKELEGVEVAISSSTPQDGGPGGNQDAVPPRSPSRSVGPSIKKIAGKDLGPDRRSFTFTIPAVNHDTTLQFTLYDTDGITSPEPIRLELAAVADQAPQVAAQLDGIGAAITAKARTPVTGRATDDYGLDQLWFEYRIDERKPKASAARSLAGRPVEFTLDGFVLELGDMQLQPGQKIRICVKASDGYNLGKKPNVGAGQPWLLDVVSPEQLRAMLEARELVLRQRFETVIQETTEARDLLARWESLFAQAPGPSSGAEPGDASAKEPAESPEQRLGRQLLRLERAITDCRKNSPETLGLAESFGDILKQLINNRLDNDDLRERLQQGIAEPLQMIAETMLPELDRRLERLRSALEQKSPQAGELRGQARSQADAALLAMQKVLERMLEQESYHEVVELLREIIKNQDQLRRRTERRQKQALKDLLQDDAPRADDGLAAEQRRIGEEFRRFEQLLARMKEVSAAGDPQRAALLEKTYKQSKDRLIDVQFDTLAALLKNGRFAQSLKNQTDLEGDLKSLLDLLLSENRQKRTESEKARIREYLRQLFAIIQQQKDVQGRTRGGDDAKQLADRQGRIAEGTGELAKHIREREEGKAESGKSPGEGQKGEGGGKQEKNSEPSKPPEGNPARQRLDAARQRMQEAEERLDQAKREGAVEKQEEALKELEQARAELEQILRQLREKEITRMLVDLEARFRKMLDAQQNVYEGTLRLDKVPAAQRTHNHESEAGRLSGDELKIVAEADKALLLMKEDGTATALPQAVEQARADMQQVADRLAQVKPDAVTQSIEQDVIAALEEIIGALQKAQKELGNRKTPPGMAPGGGPADQPLVDLLAELKMIRALQMRVNRRTERYAKLIEGEQAGNTELIEALQRLADRQREIRRVTKQLQEEGNQ